MYLAKLCITRVSWADPKLDKDQDRGLVLVLDLGFKLFRHVYTFAHIL